MSDKSYKQSGRLSSILGGGELVLSVIDPEGALGNARVMELRRIREDGVQTWQVKVAFPKGAQAVFAGSFADGGGILITAGGRFLKSTIEQFGLISAPTVVRALSDITWSPLVLCSPSKRVARKAGESLPVFFGLLEDALYFGIDGGGVEDGYRGRFSRLCAVFSGKDEVVIRDYADAPLGGVKISAKITPEGPKDKEVFYNGPFGKSGYLKCSCYLKNSSFYTPSIERAFTLAEALAVSQVKPAERDKAIGLKDELAAGGPKVAKAPEKPKAPRREKPDGHGEVVREHVETRRNMDVRPFKK